MATRLLALSAAAALGAARPSCVYHDRERQPHRGELLHNGICIPSGAGHWPPPNWYRGPNTPLPPYLQDCPAGALGPGCRPPAIDIDTGRQLFVDDFIADANRTNASRAFHSASMAADDADGTNPVVRPSLPWEASGQYLPAWGSFRSVLPFPGGVWYVHDAPPEQRYQLFYYVPSGPTAVAVSANGLRWQKVGEGLDGAPGPEGLNTLKTPTRLSASSTIWYDPNAANKSQAWSMGFQPVQLCNLYPEDKNSEYGDCSGTCALPCATAILNSADGRQWEVELNASGAEGDASSFFYNPFREKYVLSMKSGRYGRSRDYAEGDTLAEAAAASRTSHVYWASTDAHDHPCQPGGTGTHAEVYELMANGYESLMINMISIFQGKGISENSSFVRASLILSSHPFLR